MLENYLLISKITPQALDQYWSTTCWLPNNSVSCCKPRSGAGVVWVKTSPSLGQGQTWPYNGDRTRVPPALSDYQSVRGVRRGAWVRSGLRMIVPSSHFTRARALRKSRKNAVRIKFVLHHGTQSREFGPRHRRQSFLPLLCIAVIVPILNRLY